MAVNFTPNIALAKPTEAELGLEWARASKLQEDNNLIIIDKADVNLVSYTPTIIGPTTNPSIGAGSATGQYFDFQGIIFGNARFRFTDPGVAAGSGSGAYGILLPTLVDSTFHPLSGFLNSAPGNAAVIGEGFMGDATSVNLSGTVAIDAVDIGGIHYARLITETYTGKTVNWWGPTFPFTLATGDQVSINFMYKKA